MKEIKNLIVAAGHPHFFHRAPSWVAQKKGYFKQEGLKNVSIRLTGEDEDTLDGVMKGSIHIGLDIRPAIVLQENNKGSDIYIVGAFIYAMPFTLIADKNIKSAKDLKGKRIEVVGTGGGIDERQTRVYLRKNGLDPDKDVEWVRNGPFPNLAKAGARIDSGAIQARPLLSDDAPRAREQGYSILCDYLKEFYPHGYLQRAIVTSGKMINEYPDTLQAFLRAIIRGYRFLRKEENYPEANEIVYEATKDEGLGWDEMDYTKIEGQYIGYKILPRDGNITKLGFQQMIDEEKLDGKLPQDYSMDQIIRLHFVEEAAKDIDAKYGSDGYEKRG